MRMELKESMAGDCRREKGDFVPRGWVTKKRRKNENQKWKVGFEGIRRLNVSEAERKMRDGV